LGYYIEKALGKYGMWMRGAAVTILLLSLGKAEDFISEFEYGQMLYQNPRGVSCVPCHGDHGEGALIARYKEEGKTMELWGPDIRQATEATLHRALAEGPGIMPRYFLTREEERALLTYIREAERRSLEEPE
jgi:mono/diheme cytochrome c family protein